MKARAIEAILDQLDAAPVVARQPVAPIARSVETVDSVQNWCMTEAMRLVRTTNISASKAALIAVERRVLLFGSMPFVRTDYLELSKD